MRTRYPLSHTRLPVENTETGSGSSEQTQNATARGPGVSVALPRYTRTWYGVRGGSALTVQAGWLALAGAGWQPGNGGPRTGRRRMTTGDGGGDGGGGGDGNLQRCSRQLPPSAGLPIPKAKGRQGPAVGSAAAGKLSPKLLDAARSADGGRLPLTQPSTFDSVLAVEGSCWVEVVVCGRRWWVSAADIRRRFGRSARLESACWPIGPGDVPETSLTVGRAADWRLEASQKPCPCRWARGAGPRGCRGRRHIKSGPWPWPISPRWLGVGGRGKPIEAHFPPSNRPTGPATAATAAWCRP